MTRTGGTCAPRPSPDTSTSAPPVESAASPRSTEVGLRASCSHRVCVLRPRRVGAHVLTLEDRFCPGVGPVLSGWAECNAPIQPRGTPRCRNVALFGESLSEGLYARSVRFPPTPNSRTRSCLRQRSPDLFPGRKRNGTRPSHFCRGSSSVARKVLQSLEGIKMVEADANG